MVEKIREERKEIPFFLGESFNKSHEREIEKLQRTLTNIQNEISVAMKLLKDSEWEGRLFKRLNRTLEQFGKDSSKVSKEWVKMLERFDRQRDDDKEYEEEYEDTEE